MFTNNEQIHERVTPQTEMFVPYYGCDMTFQELVETLFATPDGFSITEFCDMYEFIYDSRRHWLLFIVRNARLRMRKYLYLPPVYVAFDLHKDVENYSPTFLRYYMKFAPITYQLEQDDDYAYKLSNYPYMAAYHPHVDATASACYGHWHRNIEDSIKFSGFQTMDAIRAFVNDYNGRSPFFTINPYEHDNGKSGVNAGFFPYANHQLTCSNRPEYWIHTKSIYSFHFGADWLDKFVEYSGIDKRIIYAFDFYHVQGSSEANDFASWLDTLHKMIGNDEELSKKYEYYMLPENMHYTDEGYNDAIAKRNKYFGNIDHLRSAEIRKKLTAWLVELSGYNYTKGDLMAIQKGFNNFGHLNFSGDQDKELMKMNREIMQMRDTSTSYCFQQILRTFGYRTVHSSQRFRDNQMLNLLSLLCDNQDLSSIATNSLQFEYFCAKSMERTEFVDSYRTLRVASEHDWRHLDSIVKDWNWISFDGDLPTALDNMWYFHPQQNGMQIEYFFICFINNMRYCAKRLTEEFPVCTVEHQQKLIGFLRDGADDVNWFKEFENTNPISEKEVYNAVLFKTLKEYDILGAYGDNLNEAVANHITDRLNVDNCFSDASDKDYAIECFLSGPDFIRSLQTEEEEAQVVDMFQTIFPLFPKSISLTKDYRNMYDRMVLNKASDYFTKKADKIRKGFNNVFTNTLPSVEQGELFSEQISV